MYRENISESVYKIITGGFMSKEWQQKKLKEYVLPKTVYYQALWAVRDLERMRETLIELNEDVEEGLNGIAFDRKIGNTNTISMPTEKKAIRLVDLEEKIKNIENAINLMPEEYQKGVLNNVINKELYDNSAHENTWKKWKQRFIYNVAKNLGLI